MEKRGQASLEFLMTYGWTIMVVLIAIGALSYFGVLSPDKFVPRRCALEPGLGCMDFKVNEDSVTVVLRSGKGEDITITDIKIRNCTGTASGILRNGEQDTFTIGGCNNEASKKFIGKINITYTGETGLVHKNRGNIVGKIEAGVVLGLCSSPTLNACSVTTDSITLSWDSVTGATQYTTTKCDVDEQNCDSGSTVSELTKLYSGLSSNTQYSFKVKVSASDETCTSPSSESTTKCTTETACSPSQEICDGIDNDCNDLIDDGIICECNPEETRSCGESDVGVCEFGTQTCQSNHQWGSCIGEVTPSAEICDNLDNNCDTFVDEGCDDDNDNYCDISITIAGTPDTCTSGGLDCYDANININPGSEALCNYDASCAVPADDAACGTIDCDSLDYYFTSGSASPTGTNYCKFRDYVDITTDKCEGYADCKDANTADDCTSYSDSTVATCGPCKKAEGACTSCTNYADGTSCDTNKECIAGACVIEEASLSLGFSDVSYIFEYEEHTYYYTRTFTETNGVGVTLTQGQVCSTQGGCDPQVPLNYFINGNGQLIHTNKWFATPYSPNIFTLTYWGTDDNGNPVTLSNSMTVAGSSHNP
jgi:hypothetical protein